MNDVLDDYSQEEGKKVEYAGFWIRVGAALIDSLVLLPFAILELYNKTQFENMSLLFMAALITMAYKPYFEFTKGATVGKLLLGLRVVNENLELISINQSILRSMPWILQSIIALIVSIEYYGGEERATNLLELTTMTQQSFWTELNTLYSLVFLVIIVVVAFDSKKQGLHDKIALTYCIKNVE